MYLTNVHSKFLTILRNLAEHFLPIFLLVVAYQNLTVFKESPG